MKESNTKVKEAKRQTGYAENKKKTAQREIDGMGILFA
jgi:hypothetical protein